MLARALGQDAIVTLEYPNGQMFRGRAIASEVNVRQEVHHVQLLGHEYGDVIGGPTSWEMTFSGVGALEFSLEDATTMRERMYTRSEWRCEYCGAIMTKGHRSCTACGAFRSFLYDV